MKSVTIFHLNNLYIVEEGDFFWVYVHGVGKCFKTKKNHNIIARAEIACRIKFNFADVICLCALMLSPICEAFVLYKLISFNWATYTISWHTIVLNIVFLIINILLHEFGHWIVMIIHNISIDVPKIQYLGHGIKIYTETGAAVLFPWYRRMLVYGIGIFINSLTMMILILTNLTPYVILTMVVSLFNIIPIYGVVNDVAMIVDTIKNGGYGNGKEGT